MTITGIDVSGYQSETYDLSGHDFVFVKATEGVSYTNPRHAAQVTRARNNGRVVGHYHYLNGTSSMSAQVVYFLGQAGAKPGDLLALDWEEAAVTSAQKDQALKYLQKQAPGHRVLLYCNRDFWLNRDTSSYRADGLWIAQYNGHPGAPDIDAAWVVHQYTSDPIDTNMAAFSSRSAMAAWAAGEEPEVALTDAEIDKIAAASALRTLKLDGVIASDTGSSTNPYVSLATITRNSAVVSRRVEDEVKALTTKVDQALALLDAIDPDALAAAVAASVGGYVLTLTKKGA